MDIKTDLEVVLALTALRNAEKAARTTQPEVAQVLAAAAQMVNAMHRQWGFGARLGTMKAFRWTLDLRVPAPFKRLKGNP